MKRLDSYTTADFIAAFNRNATLNRSEGHFDAANFYAEIAFQVEHYGWPLWTYRQNTDWRGR